jgi:hypothetical protein
MKKILILAYYYPPANFVGGQRAASWAKYLHEFGYYPIIITRQWNNGQTDLIDKVVNNELEVEYNQSHEVHRLPFKRSLRDRCANYKWLKPIQKALTLLELIASNFFISALPFANFYGYAKKLLKENKEITVLIASGRPFQLFAIGHQLKKDFPRLKWVPDYRDEWNSFQNNYHKARIQKLLGSRELKSELKWTKNAIVFFTVSDYWKDRISTFLSKPGHAIMNGFESNESVQFAITNSDFSKIEISYIGSLYSYQPIELFIEEIKRIISENKSEIRIRVNFIGINVSPNQVERVNRLILGYEEFFYIFNRMPLNELIKFYENSDFLLATSYEYVKGWYPVKIFDYATSGKPILLFPSDNDVIHRFIEETNSGIVIEDQGSFKKTIERLFDAKINQHQLSFELRNLNNYSRKHQASLLAKALNSLLKVKTL